MRAMALRMDAAVLAFDCQQQGTTTMIAYRIIECSFIAIVACIITLQVC